MKKSRFKDIEGNSISLGDIVSFSYGIPQRIATGPVMFEKGRFIVLTPRHNPKWVYLSYLIKNFEVEKVRS